ncbi:MAG TPA: DeoR/GlpR family DNA-binding transcription regulator [Thermomicrobiales bacterium]|nr:DeoR/GlpR family DNA-binding transcription regulator [Thermomicrobiales bacterium]
MLDAERRQQIVAYVEERNGATVGELSETFGVSEATARRDLVLLSRQGLIERAHGGAVPRQARAQRGFPEPPILVRAGLNAAEKRRIGEAAARFVEDGDTIIVNGGTTTEHMVPFLGDRQRLTVITNALNVATLLAAHPHVTVVMLGGVLRHASFSLLGLLAEDALANLRADKLFAGIPALHPDYGLSNDDMTEAQMDRAILAAAREVTILADHSKFGNVATVRLAPMSRVKRVVTDGKTPADHLDALREQGILVEVA